MMRTHNTGRMLATSTLVVAMCMIFTSQAFASPLILSGWDLLQSQGSSFNFNTVPNPQVVAFDGLPLGVADFGFGLNDFGLNDTIIRRTQNADLGSGSDTIDIELVALSLVSTSVIDLGFGAGFEDLFITLNTSSPSIQSTMTIFDTLEGAPHGTFDWEINYSFDVTGSVGGFYATIENTVNSVGSSWQHAPTGTPVINGINHLLDGGTETKDFWLAGTATGLLGGQVSPVPEPGTALLVGVGLVGLAARRRGTR